MGQTKGKLRALGKAGACLTLGLIFVVGGSAGLAIAQTAPDTTSKGRNIAIGPKPDWSWLPQLRVLTEVDYPPFNYYDEEGRLSGFSVDLANAICRELAISCNISTADWKSLTPAIKANEADAIVASVAINAKTLQDLDFTERYYTTPARFVSRAGNTAQTISPSALKGKGIAVVAGSAHEAFLKEFFPASRIVSFATQGEARKALQAGAVDYLFGDGIALMFWTQGTDSQRCCEFKGESYFDPAYFGDGVGIAIKKGNTRLREVLDYGLARVKASGRYEELMLRYFPLPLY